MRYIILNKSTIYKSVWGYKKMKKAYLILFVLILFGVLTVSSVSALPLTINKVWVDGTEVYKTSTNKIRAMAALMKEMPMTRIMVRQITIERNLSNLTKRGLISLSTRRYFPVAYVHIMSLITVASNALLAYMVIGSCSIL